MKLALVGPGSVGLWLAARLARSGAELHLLTRDAARARELREHGIEAEDLASGDTWHVRVEAEPLAEVGPDALGEAVLVCTRSGDTEAVASSLAALSFRGPVVSMQNGVDNEELLARTLPHVLGGVFRQTATRLGVTRVRSLGRGRIVLGTHPQGVDAPARRLAGALERAGFDVGLSPRITADKWLKLCINLMSAPNALVRREDHRSAAFVEVKARLLEEARAVLAAAGIETASGDGRDRSLDEEISYQRGALARGASARLLPLYNHVWTALREGRPLESDTFHQRILALAEQHACAAPVNARVLAALLEAAREGLGPECFKAVDLLAGTETGS